MKKFTKTMNIRSKDIQRKWYIADANDKILGRLAGKIARILTGKDKVQYSPNLDCGDFVIVVNADKIRVTGKKMEQKIYFRHSGFPRGARYIQLEKLLAQHPERVIKMAVKGMLPQSRLGNKMLTKLKVYKGAAHPHSAQVPVLLNI